MKEKWEIAFGIGLFCLLVGLVTNSILWGIIAFIGWSIIIQLCSLYFE